MLVTVSGTERLVRSGQFMNASLPMLVTPLGIVTLVRPTQETSIESLTAVKFSGIAKLASLSQQANASSPMMVTLDGTLTLVIPVQ